MTVKIPAPITAPMPSAVNDHGPSVFLSRCSGSSEFAISLSMDFLAKNWLGRARLREVGLKTGTHDFNASCRRGQDQNPTRITWRLHGYARIEIYFFLFDALEKCSFVSLPLSLLGKFA